MPSLRARWSVVCLAVAICFITPTLLSAQGTNGRILGHVVDPSGAVLPGAKVTLVNEATSVSRDSKTSDNGDYDFVEVPVGTYRHEGLWFDIGRKEDYEEAIAAWGTRSLDLVSVLHDSIPRPDGAVASASPLRSVTSADGG